MSKESTQRALEGYIKKQEPKAKPRKKKEPRQAPEKQVEKEVKAWLERQGFFITVVEAKASTAHHRYGQKAVSAGFPDLVGVSPNGHAVFIELKAPNNKNGLSRSQYEFLKSACRKNAFAVHTWSVDDLHYKYSMYLAGKNMDEFLPEKFKLEDEEPLFLD